MRARSTQCTQQDVAMAFETCSVSAEGLHHLRMRGGSIRFTDSRYGPGHARQIEEQLDGTLRPAPEGSRSSSGSAPAHARDRGSGGGSITVSDQANGGSSVAQAGAIRQRTTRGGWNRKSDISIVGRRGHF